MQFCAIGIIASPLPEQSAHLQAVFLCDSLTQRGTIAAQLRVTRSAQKRSDRYSVASLLTTASPLPEQSAHLQAVFSLRFLSRSAAQRAARLRVTRSAQRRSDRYSVASLLTTASPLPEQSACLQAVFSLRFSHAARHKSRAIACDAIGAKAQRSLFRRFAPYDRVSPCRR